MRQVYQESFVFVNENLTRRTVRQSRSGRVGPGRTHSHGVVKLVAIKRFLLGFHPSPRNGKRKEQDCSFEECRYLGDGEDFGGLAGQN